MTRRLLWSAGGRIDCEAHAPVRGSDEWESARWEAMPEEVLEEWVERVGAPPACETCASAHGKVMALSTMEARALTDRMFNQPKETV